MHDLKFWAWFWTLVAAVMIVGIVSTSYYYQAKYTIMTTNGYEEVYYPGTSFPIWQKVNRAK